MLLTILILATVFLFLYWSTKRIVKKMRSEDAMSQEVERHINLKDDL